MRKPAVLAVVVMTLGAVLMLSGCSSTSTPDGSLLDNSPALKITEYVGDGHNGTKPLLFPLLGSPAQSDAVLPQASPTTLYYGANYLYTNVAPKATNWFYLPPLTSAALVVVTMQPVCNRDADLYLLQGIGPFTPDMPCLGYSNRSPTAPGDTVAGQGYAPDWVSYDFTNGTGGYPAAHIVCYGCEVSGDPGARYFRLEADVCESLPWDGTALQGALGTGQSAWYVFSAPVGEQSRLGLHVLSGTAGVYVYRTYSTAFLTKADSGGYVYFTPLEIGPLFARVYAHTACQYRIRLFITP